MKNIHIYQTTTSKETLEPHVFIDNYNDSDTKVLLHRYKFTKDTHLQEVKEVKKILVQKTLDICLEAYISSRKGMIIYTNPPSTMYVRGEKAVDSMFEILQTASTQLLQLTQKLPGTYVYMESIFSVSHTYLKQKRAQHIDGNRKSRIKNINNRYNISLKHIFYIYYCIYLRKIRHFSYIIIDDVSSTGATLVACKDQILRHMSLTHRNNPHISYDVRIFSLTH